MDDPDGPEQRDHLRVARPKPLSLIERSRSIDPVAEPLAEGTPRPALTSIALRTDGDRVTATITLALHGRVLSASQSGDAGDRTRVVAEAALESVAQLLGAPASLESAQVVEISGRDIAISVVQMQLPTDTPGARPRFEVLVGSAIVRGDSEDATARSVLSALNRRLGV